MMTPEQMANSLGGARRDGRGFVALCPVHADHKPSLAIDEGDDGRPLVHCRAGCDQASVWSELKARGLLNGHEKVSGSSRPHQKPQEALCKPPKDVQPPTMIDRALGAPASSWAYRDAAGDVLFYVARYDTQTGKQIKPWSWNGSAWVQKAWSKPRPLYGLDRLAANPNAPVLVVEGEKCADAADGCGYVVITWQGGANGVSSADWSPLKGRDVTIWPDADDPGKKAADDIQAIIGPCKVVDVSGKPKGWDVADAVAEGWTPAQVLEFIETEASKPTTPTRRNIIDFAQWIGKKPPPFEWILKHWLSWHPTLIAALGGMGKTLLMLMIAVALASGKAFLGPARDRVRVLLWLCEDDSDEIWRRLDKICEYFEVDLADLAGWLIIDARRGLDNTLYTTDFGKPVWTGLIEDLRQEVNDYRADVLVLDNIAQIFAANPNAPHDTTAFINGVVGLVQDRPFAPILVGHTARAEGSEYANSAAWENAVRMRWYLGDRLPDQKMQPDEDIDNAVRFLCKRKANYAQKDYIRFSFQNGVLVPDAVEQDSGIIHALYENRARAVLIEAMGKLAAMGKVMSDSKGANYLPKMIAQYKLAEGISFKDLESAMRSAQTMRLIRKDEVGKYANRAPRFGLVVTEK